MGRPRRRRCRHIDWSRREAIRVAREIVREAVLRADQRHVRIPARLGERVRILPNHVCVVTNLHDQVVVSRDGLVEGIWPVAARGLTR